MSNDGTGTCCPVVFSMGMAESYATTGTIYLLIFGHIVSIPFGVFMILSHTLYARD